MISSKYQINILLSLHVVPFYGMDNNVSIPVQVFQYDVYKKEYVEQSITLNEEKFANIFFEKKIYISEYNERGLSEKISKKIFYLEISMIMTVIL